MTTEPAPTGIVIKGKSLISKLAEVMKEIDTIPKSGRNDFHKYDYATEMDILRAVREKLAERSIFLFTSVESTSRQGDITEVHTLHEFVDGQTGEVWQVKGYGQGQDKNDKGGYKAMTGAMKYLLLKNFLMPTGDDPEHEDGKKTSLAKPAPKAAPKPPPATPEQIAEIENLARTLGLDLKTAIYDKMGIETPTNPQAVAIIKRLRTKLEEKMTEDEKSNS